MSRPIVGLLDGLRVTVQTLNERVASATTPIEKKAAENMLKDIRVTLHDVHQRAEEFITRYSTEKAA